MLRKLVSYIPNTITSLNLLAGCVACALAFVYDDTIGALHGYQWAFIAIGAAAIFDFLDGAAARMLHAYSELGKQLDSLADLISFGLAPTMLTLNTFLYFNADFTPWALASIAIALCGALRLARFNIDTRQTTYFIGLPIPANAIFFIGWTAWIHSHTYPGNFANAAITILVALPMVSNLRMFSLKFKNFSLRENFRRYVIILAAILFFITEGAAGFAWTILLYILISAVASKKNLA